MLIAPYVSPDKMTIADFGLVAATLCLEAIDYDLKGYPTIARWYADFKAARPDLWTIAQPAMEELHGFFLNPPDLSALK